MIWIRIALLFRCLFSIFLQTILWIHYSSSSATASYHFANWRNDIGESPLPCKKNYFCCIWYPVGFSSMVFRQLAKRGIGEITSPTVIYIRPELFCWFLSISGFRILKQGIPYSDQQRLSCFFSRPSLQSIKKICVNNLDYFSLFEEKWNISSKRHCM